MHASLPIFLARLGIASCFLGFGIWELIAPNLWTAYVPEFAGAIVDPTLLVSMHGVVLTVTALGVLSGKLPRFFTAVATLILLEICIDIFLQEGFTDIFIRDVSILLFAAALFADAVAPSHRA